MSPDATLQNHVSTATGRTLAALREAGADVLVATSPANVQYLTGYRSFNHAMHITNQTFVVLTLEGKRVLVLPNTEVDFCSMLDPRVDQVRTFGTFYVESADSSAGLTAVEADLVRFLPEMVRPVTWAEALREALKSEGLVSANLAVDQGHLMPSYWQLLQETLPQARLQDAYPMMLRVRSSKTLYEVETLQQSSHCTETAILASLKVAARGGTDYEIRDAFEKSIIDSDAEHLFSVIGVGTRTALSNIQPNGTRMEPGRLLRFDIGCRYHGYASDLARNAMLGPAPEKVRRYYQAILAGEQAAIGRMRPGVPACEVFDAAVNATRKNGLANYRRHHCGHGIGLDTYEPPILRPDDRTPLAPGMTFCVETPYYELGLGGLQVEDMVVVTESGCEILTSLSRELFELAS